jgi:RHS repeat-associated protein
VTDSSGNVVRDYVNGSWQWWRGYVYQGSQLLAVHQDGVFWVHEDPVTKSKRVTDANGNVVSTLEPDPWGAYTNRYSNGSFQPREFTSYERDGNRSDEAMFRRYNRWHSRFDQPDPYDGSYETTNPQSFNRYAYVQGDPVNLVDPSGLCTFNINISGLSGQALTDMQNEITRIFNTGGQNVVFGQQGQANGGSMNVAVVSQYTGQFAANVSSQGLSPANPGILGVTPPGGASQVNQTNIGSGTFSYSSRRASLGTMIGRITSHEVIEHGFLNIRQEGVMADDITFGRYTPTQLSSPTNSLAFSISSWTAARLNQLCPPPPPQVAPAAKIGRGIGGAGREILPIFRGGGFSGWTSLDFLYIMFGLNRPPARQNRRY